METVTLSHAARRLFRLIDPLDPVPPPAGFPHLDGDRWQRLRAILLHRTDAPVAAISLIGFDDLRHRLGPRWALVAERVRMLAERLLDRHTDPDDVWFLVEDDTFAIAFAHCGIDEAKHRCAEISAALHRLLIGEPDLTAIAIETVVMEADGLMRMERTPLAELLLAAVAPGGAIPGGPGVAPGPAPTTGGPAPCGPAAQATPCAPSRPQAAERPADEGVEIAYSPIWDVRNAAVTTYIATPCRCLPGGVELRGYEALTRADGEAVLALDLRLLREAATALDELVRNRFRLNLSLPVHVETLASSSRRMRYLAACTEALPAQLAKSMLFTLSAYPGGMPAGRVAEMVSALKAHGRAVFVAGQIGPADTGVLAAAGVAGIGIYLSPAQQRDLQEGEAHRLVTSAARARLRSFFGNVRTADTARTLADAGADFIQGAAIGKPQPMPENMLRFTAADLH
ncbi:MAG: hypothetical protein RLY86_366 [Pseudomonadota bacterium]|jgi:EAL domain-containing protein (putative c-di-GMP-specific phosphodiesterase class I)